MNQKLQITISLIILSMGLSATPAQAATQRAQGVTVAANPDEQLQARRYEAHGYFWNGAEFEYEYQGRQPRFADQDTFAEVLGDAGIVWQNSAQNWRWDELVMVTTAVVKLSHQVGGIDGGARLNMLLGGRTIHFVRGAHSAAYPGATAERNLDHITFYNEAFDPARSTAEIEGTVVHELAHLIGDENFTADRQYWRVAFPYQPNGLGLMAPGTYRAGNPEYFAEAVKLWVLPDYPTAWHLDNDQQWNWLQQMLHG
jgi:hypothetical protein